MKTVRESISDETLNALIDAAVNITGWAIGNPGTGSYVAVKVEAYNAVSSAGSAVLADLERAK